MTLNLSEIPGAFHLPRPNWGVISDWVEAHVPEADRRQAWTDVAEQWLSGLNEALGNHYRIEQSEHLLLFAPGDDERTMALLRFGPAALGARFVFSLPSAG